MIENVPAPIAEEVAKTLRSVLGVEVKVLDFSFSDGGCINNGGKLTTTAGEYFLKWNNAKKLPGMFDAESRGLEIIRSTHAIDVAKPVVAGVAQDYQFLVLEFVTGSDRNAKFWENLGVQLAAMHQNTRESYGLDHDNYIGSLPQLNKPDHSWIDFFIEKRLQAQLSMQDDQNLLQRGVRSKFDALFKRLPELLVLDKPALLHGDLWSGNLIVNASGDPCLIDPAVYYGHREVELAFTTLFGGFDRRFYDAYQSHYALNPGYRERFEIYNLYPLLVHANLFGGHYLAQAISIVGQFT